MVLPPEDYETAAREADCHIQMVIEDVTVLPGEAELSGCIVKVFRGEPGLAGTRMTLRVACFAPGQDEDWPPDGTGRFPVGELRAGRVLEALVNHTASGPEIPLGLSGILDVSTDTPQIRTD